MDAIILAAGRNERLNGYVQPFMKPLVVVNGEPLIRRHVRTLSDSGYNRIVIVASPHNVASIVDVLDDPDRVRIVIQAVPQGPVHAVLRGLDVAQTTAVCIACADNTVPDNLYRDILQLHVTADQNVVVTSNVPTKSASRFTRLHAVPNSPGDYLWKDGPLLPNQDNTVTCWIGPVVVNRKAFMHAVASTGEARRLGPLFQDSGPFRLFKSTVVDIGTPDSLYEHTEVVR